MKAPPKPVLIGGVALIGTAGFLYYRHKKSADALAANQSAGGIINPNTGALDGSVPGEGNYPNDFAPAPINYSGSTFMQTPWFYPGAPTAPPLPATAKPPNPVAPIVVNLTKPVNVTGGGLPEASPAAKLPPPVARPTPKPVKPRHPKHAGHPPMKTDHHPIHPKATHHSKPSHPKPHKPAKPPKRGITRKRHPVVAHAHGNV